MVVRLKRCPRCQRNVERDADVCSGCGGAFAFRASRHEYQRNPSALPPLLPLVAPAPHDVSIALSASLLLPGTGQMYNHQVAKGVAMLLVTLVATVLTIWLWSTPFALVTLALWAVSIFDAALVAGREINQESVRPWQWF